MNVYVLYVAFLHTAVCISHSRQLNEQKKKLIQTQN